MKKKALFISIAVIIIINIVLHLNILENQFVWDDRVYIQENLEMRSFENIPEAFTKSGTGNLYRPLRNVLYTLVYSLSELNPLGYHINAIFWHTLNSILVLLIIYSLFSSTFVSFLSSQ